MNFSIRGQGSLRFIGSKRRLLPFIKEVLLKHVGGQRGTVGDLFCGTGAVSELLKLLGFRVIANDNLKFCSLQAESVLKINQVPCFKGLADLELSMRDQQENSPNSPYDRVLYYLNILTGIQGFIYGEYSLEGTSGNPFQRQYFSGENAAKIDAIRHKIEEWKCLNLITRQEFTLLITNLIAAVNEVANTAGTYGYFMKNIEPRARKRLTLKRSSFIHGEKQHEVYCMDANELISHQYFDVIYLDPPYTWRHYGSYYHILETIVLWDKPALSGRSGLRPWQNSKSRYCDRQDAAKVLAELILVAKCEHVLMSYNSEGLIPHDSIMDILALRGTPQCYEIPYRRYKSNSGGSQENQTKERLYYVKTQ